MIRQTVSTQCKQTLLACLMAGVIAIAAPAPQAHAGLLEFFTAKKTTPAPAAEAAKQAPAPTAAAPAAAPATDAKSAPTADQPRASGMPSGLPQAQGKVAAPLPIDEPKAAATGKNAKTPTYKEVNAQELIKMMASKNPPYVIDVRDPVEFQEFHMEGAINIPLGSIAGSVSTLPKDRDIVVYCRTGRRSEIAQKALYDFGVTNVSNLTGGIFVWASTNKCDLKKKTC